MGNSNALFWLLAIAGLGMIPLPIFKMTTQCGTPGAYSGPQTLPAIQNWNSITNQPAPTTPARVITVCYVNRSLWQKLANPFPGGI